MIWLNSLDSYCSPQLHAVRETQKKLSSTVHQVTLVLFTSQIWLLHCNLEDAELASSQSLHHQVFDPLDGLLICPELLSSTSVDKHPLPQ